MTNWEDKIKAFLHDPPTKALNIRGHKEVSRRFLDVWYISSGGDEIYDQIAASADRPGVPGYDEGCAVDFKEVPEIIHPISKGRLKLDLSDLNVSSVENYAIQTLSEMRLNETDNEKSKFFTIFEGLKQKLSINEPALYSIWNKIPADTRVPDHSIWHHNSLVSALSVCKNEPYFFIFSLGPVQGFISESRKLRDLWVSSVILSYLSWVGMRVICDKFGPDHIVYPSLSGQPLFYNWLRETKLTETVALIDEDSNRIASFPNKFVALLPKDSVESTAKEIKNNIIEEWNKISDSVYDSVNIYAGADPDYFYRIWQRQNKNLWEFYWTASPWLNRFTDKLATELPEQDMKKTSKLAELFEQSSGYKMNQGILYQPSHELAQGMLAASKNSRQFFEGYGEPGDKCVQCGKRQQLSVAEYRDVAREFWKRVSDGQEIKEDERVCSICLIKRFIYKNCASLPSQLQDIVRGSEFPSSTQMAFSPIKRKLESNGKLYIWDDFVKQCNGNEQEAYNLLHDNDEKNDPDGRVKALLKRLKDDAHIDVNNIFGKYYAILMMDGDKMGDLVNGKAEKLATWRDIMHSSLPAKMKDSTARSKTRGWLEDNRLGEKRHLTPSVHKAISESLGDFSLNSVPYVITRYHGRLIYAGGDDLLAVMPIDTVLKAAQEIRELYRTPFLIRKVDGSIEKCTDNYQPNKDEKLLIHPGEASTISASIIIAHHKEPLRRLIIDAHSILDHEAKEKTGRDAIAISLKKRSGSDRTISEKWIINNSEKFIDKLLEVVNELAEEKESSKLMYKIEENRIAIETLKVHRSDDSVEKFIESLIEKGERDKGLKDDKFKKTKKERARRLMSVMIFDKDNKLNTDGLMISRFLAQCIRGE